MPSRSGAACEIPCNVIEEYLLGLSPKAAGLWVVENDERDGAGGVDFKSWL